MNRTNQDRTIRPVAVPTQGIPRIARPRQHAGVPAVHEIPGTQVRHVALTSPSVCQKFNFVDPNLELFLGCSDPNPK